MPLGVKFTVQPGPAKRRCLTSTGARMHQDFGYHLPTRHLLPSRRRSSRCLPPCRTRRTVPQRHVRNPTNRRVAEVELVRGQPPRHGRLVRHVARSRVTLPHRPESGGSAAADARHRHARSPHKHHRGDCAGRGRDPQVDPRARPSGSDVTGSVAVCRPAQSRHPPGSGSRGLAIPPARGRGA